MCNRQFCSQNTKCVMNLLRKRSGSFLSVRLSYMIIVWLVEQIDSCSFSRRIPTSIRNRLYIYDGSRSSVESQGFRGQVFVSHMNFTI
jgi:hypothetical protein